MKMKKIMPFLFLFYIFFILSTFKPTFDFTKNVWVTFIFFIIPSLAPIILLSNLFQKADGLSIISKKAHIPQDILIITLGLLSGTPVLFNYVNDSSKKKKMELSQCQRIINCFTMPSIPFLFATLTNNSSQIVIIITTLLSSFMFYFFNKPKIKKEVEIENDTSFNNNIIKVSIIETAKSLILIGGTMLLFSLPFLIFKLFLNDFWSFSILGIFEFSYPLTILSHNNDLLSTYIIAFISSFGSLSLFLQAKLTCKSINLKSLISTRIKIVFLSITLFTLYTLFTTFI